MHGLIKGLTIGAVAWQGLWVGGVTIRALVDTPAWRRLGPSAWSAFSRHADLGPGLLFYPLLAIVGWVIVLAAAILDLLQPGGGAARLPLALAALWSIAGAVTTAVAAPTMLGNRGMPADSPALPAAFARFTLWGVYVRGAVLVLSFLCSLWALVVL